MKISFEIPDQLFIETMLVASIDSNGFVEGKCHPNIAKPRNAGWLPVNTLDVSGDVNLTILEKT